MRSKLLLCIAFLFAAGCQEYDAPPSVRLVTPPTGTFLVGDPIVLAFGEPVEGSSLRLSVYPSQRTIENELEAGVEAQLRGCGVGACEGGELTLSEDGLEAQLVPGEAVGPPGKPLVMVVEAGLSDRGGSAWKIPQELDFQISPDTEAPSEEPVVFDNGHYVLLAETTQPLQAVIRIITEVEVQEDGATRMAGGKGSAVEGAPRNTTEPSEMFIDTSESGFGVFIQGRVTVRDGERFLNTEPFQVDLVVLGIRLVMTGLQLTGTVVEEEGQDRLTGTLSFEKLLLYTSDTPIEFSREQVPPVPFVGRYLAPAEVPEGAPRLCGALCGAVTAQCAPPEGFPGAGFCGE
jgi:hypothetical protein